ncbi:MotA/TolQ/ExbB proton channel family protein [Lentisphaera profundi]|uniref:MotA/TolQ/ExbB proton channel family protein n=1 Tax=Lentisphaera profundi TaxID=1658616 RepID=A0ABY7VYT8_9BACT|nr:MotA/TolQ/ExbB proton channel family protein [Lentisphaera profundi]WDE97213.1 MotA/TolQ/ExbB proton channel family protein [Lentisphaera profundi]
MKKVLFSLCFLLVNAYAVELSQVSKDLQASYLGANKALAKQEQSIFKERQALLTQMDADKAELAKSASQNLDNQISLLQKELEQVLNDINQLEDEQDDFKIALLDQRREFESLISQQEIDQEQTKLKALDSLIESKDFSQALNSYFDITSSIVNQGSTTHLGKAKVANIQGQVLEADSLSISRAKHYYKLEKSAGIGQIKNNSPYPQIIPINGSEQAFSDFAESANCTLQFDFSDGLVFKDSAKEKTLQDHLKAGGIMVYPLLFLGFICIIIALYKFIQLYSIRSQYDDKVIKLISLIKEDKLEEAEQYVKQLKKPIRALLGEALKYKDAPRVDLEELLNETILSELPRLDRLMHILSVSAGAAPLMGLLGTVMGIIKTFEMIGIYGTSDANQLSLGISEALVTTEVGLLVAIPTLITYALLNRRLRTIISSLEKASLSFINGSRA